MIPFGKIGMMCLFLTAPAWAQNLISVRAGLINFAEGNVYINESQLQFSEEITTILKVGENLSTGLGWVEIQAGAGAYLRMGTGGLLRMEDSDLTDMQFRVNRGSVMIEIFDEVDDNKILIHFRGTTIDLKEEGLYRLDCSLSQFRVYGGKADILQSRKKTTLKRGKTLFLGDIKASKFDTEEIDLLHRWAAQRSLLLHLINKNTRHHWRYLRGGWIQNEYYGVEAYSPILHEEQAHRQLEVDKRSERQRKIILEQATREIERKWGTINTHDHGEIEALEELERLRKR